MTEVTIGQYAGRIAKTKRVRVCVVIDSEGKWEAVGSHSMTDEKLREDINNVVGYLGGPPRAYHWIEADVPIPIGMLADIIEGEIVQ